MLTIPQINIIVKRARKRAKSRTWPQFYLTMEYVDAYLDQCHAEQAAAQKAEAGRVAVVGKICGHCEEDLPFAKFNHRSSAKDGYCYLCKKCKKAYDKGEWGRAGK